MHADHTLAGNGDDGLTVHRGDRLDRIRAQRTPRRHLRAGGLGIDERAHLQDDPGSGDRNERTRVQHLRTVVRHFGGFTMVQLRDEARVANDTGIGREDARNVFPEDDAPRSERSAEQRRRQIRTAAAERGDAAVGCASDESRYHGNRSLREKRSNQTARIASGFREVGSRGSMLAIC